MFSPESRHPPAYYLHYMNFTVDAKSLHQRLLIAVIHHKSKKTGT
jgi:hypothetical protein